MIVVFLSPAFPPTAPAFCTALAREGVTVLGIGDQDLTAERQRACGLTHYLFEPRMGEHQPLRDATEALRRRFGRIDRIESNGEHWLAAEARLRDELGVPGLSLAALRRQSSKLTMAELFGQASIAYPPTVPSADASGVRAFAATYGYPLVLKPEIGLRAVDTHCITNAGELEAVLERQPQGRVVQPFVTGQSSRSMAWQIATVGSFLDIPRLRSGHHASPARRAGRLLLIRSESCRRSWRRSAGARSPRSTSSNLSSRRVFPPAGRLVHGVGDEFTTTGRLHHRQ